MLDTDHGQRMMSLEPASPGYPRWSNQEGDCPETSPSQSVTSSPSHADHAYDQPQRRSSGSSFDESDSDVEVTYTCPCGKRFNRATAYKRHLDVAHSNTESYKCTVCSKTFGNERTLTMHMSVHQDSKQFSSTLERCSKSKSSRGHHRKDITFTPAQVEKIKAASNGAKAMNIECVDKNVSIIAASSSIKHEDSTPTSREHYVLSEGTISCSEDETVGTDKENCSPKHDSSGDCSDTSDTLSTDSISIPPLVNGKYSATNLELDLTLPKSKPEGLGDDTVITSNGTVAQSCSISRYTESKNVTGIEPNKVSVITIKTDRSLLSESVILRAKGSKSGDFYVNPAGHSVIVIKTQETKNKVTVSNVKPETSQTGNKSTNAAIDVESVRKSQRLQGKIPGWKHILVDKDDISAGYEGRGKRRKMAKVKIEEPSSGMMEDALAADLIDKHENPYKRLKLSNSVYACSDMGKTGIFKCPICDKSFESEKYLSMHMSLHKVDNSMESLMAQNNKDDEAENNNVTINVKPGQTPPTGAFWTCKICSKVFAQNSNYKNHIRTHSDERPFVCQICSIGFKERYHLKKHMLFKHSDELKEECQFCGKKFKDSTAVRAHERIHSDDRPYSCRRCGKSFKTSECLWHHENRSKTCGQALLGIPSPGPRFKRGRQPKKEIKVEKNNLSGITVIPVASNGQHFIQRDSVILSSSQHFIQPQVPATPTHVNEVALATASIQAPQPATLVPTTTMFDPALVKFSCPSSVATANTHIATLPHNSTRIPQIITQMSHVSTPIPQVSMPVSHVSMPVSQVSMPVSQVTTPIVNMSMPLPQTVASPLPSKIETHFPQIQHFNPLPSSTPVLVKVEPEAALPDYELTAMASSDGSFEDTNSDLMSKEDPEMPSAHMMESETGLGDISHETMLQVQEELKKDPVLEDIGMLLLDGSVGAQELIDDDLMDDNDEDTDELASSTSTLDNLDNKFTCEKCNKSFSSSAAFDKHLLTHSGLRPYVCDLCGVGFKLKVHLKKHCLYRHSDEKPCECRICGKKFKDSSAVRLHERIHSDDRPFHCECGKTFKTRENLWGHRHRGPCETKQKYTMGTSPAVVSESISTTASEFLESCNVPVVAQAQLGDTHVSAQASIMNNQIIARAVVSNRNGTAEAIIGNNGEVKASASITGPDGRVESTTNSVQNAVKADLEPAALPRAFTPIVSQQLGPIIIPKSVESKVNLPFITTASSAGVPTAVVAPLMRQTPQIPVTASSMNPQSVLKTVKLVPQEPPVKNITTQNEMDKAEAATLPPFETFSPKLRGKAPTLADRCPTIQKYLQMSRQPIKLPGIQQLFQSHSKTQTHPINGTALESQNQNMLSLRRPDPEAPLGPHPAQLKEVQIISKTPDQVQLPTSTASQLTAISPHPLLMGQTGLAKPTQQPVSFPASMVTTRLTPAQLLRATSPYPGAVGIPSLPLLQLSDPNLASTSGEGLVIQSPVEVPVTAAGTPVHWEYEEAAKKAAAAAIAAGMPSVWHSEQEQLFLDLTQTTAFGQL